jgi:hypothetical protein
MDRISSTNEEMRKAQKIAVGKPLREEISWETSAWV